MRGYFKLKQHICTFKILWFAILSLGIKIHINPAPNCCFLMEKSYLIEDEKSIIKSNLIYRILIGGNNIDLF